MQEYPATGEVKQAAGWVMTVPTVSPEHGPQGKGTNVTAGSTMDKVIKTTVFIKEMNDFAAINEVYAKYFPQPYPARSCVEVARLPKDVMLEIEVIAEK